MSHFSLQHITAYILIVLDKDLVQNLPFYDFGVSQAIEDMLKWLLIKINNMIEVQHEDLRKR